MKFSCALAAVGAALTFAGCSLGNEKPKEIPPPFEPTDSKEAARVQREVKVYARDARLIRNERVTCLKQIGPAQFDLICRPFITPLAAQQHTHLRESVGGLRGNVGPKCGAALKRVFAQPTIEAGPDLRRAARICNREYRAAIAP